MSSPVVNDSFQLEKYPGKGGWTYVVIPRFEAVQTKSFGMVTVKGKIDSYELKAYNLMPMKGGDLFLPVKAEIRKKISKQEGDWVHVILYEDQDPLEIPQELELCLLDDPAAKQTFYGFRESDQKLYVDWINAAKRDETKVKRIGITLDRLGKGMRFYDKED
ncbi:MAG: hypothetical protein K0R65_2702 [Crocinitomicaceae bacterium]|jgi:hypothetical protein|nr:hypothetical protein [Crocinitomicaceae bacterium]